MNAESPNKTPRTVTPRKEVIFQERQKANLSQDALAHLARVCTQSIRKAEKGHQTFVSTLACIATALELKLEDLIAPSQSSRSRPPMPEDQPLLQFNLAGATKSSGGAQSGERGQFRIKVNLCVEGDYRDFVENDRIQTFCQRLSELIHACHATTPLEVSQGSIIVTVEMARTDYARLTAAFDDELLEELGVNDIETDSESVSGGFEVVSDDNDGADQADLNFGPFASSAKPNIDVIPVRRRTWPLIAFASAAAILLITLGGTWMHYQRRHEDADARIATLRNCPISGSPAAQLRRIGYANSTIP